MDAVLQLARVPRRPPPIDVAIAAALLAWALAEAVLADGSGPVWARALVAAAFTLPLIWRRRAPVVALAVILGALVVAGALGDAPESGAMPFPALLVAAFSCALYARPAWLAGVTAFGPAAGIAAATLLGYFSGSPTAADYAVLIFLSTGAWVAGWVVRRRAAQVEQARAAGPELARAAVAAERTRVARELHDVVAHSVTLVSVQAGAAEALLDVDPEAARPHLEAVRRSAHEALVELRRLVGVLREDEPTYTPQPGLERLRELVDEARATGADVELVQEGERPAVPLGVDLAAYRIVQEGLTNARRHAAGAPARVRVAYRRDALEVEVVNAAGGRPVVGSPAGTGHGVIGMHERARLYGGTLEAEPRPDGGFGVRAWLPLEAEA